MLEQFGNRLMKLRDNTGKTQMQVSKETGINNKTLSGYERGISEPDYETLIILAQYFKVSTDYLLGLSNKTIKEERIMLKKITITEKLTQEVKGTINGIQQEHGEDIEGIKDLYDSLYVVGHCKSYNGARLYYVAYTLAELDIEFTIE